MCNADGKVERFEHFILAPHEVFAALWNSGQAIFKEHMLNDHNPAEYWPHFTSEQWYRDHPYKRVLDESPQLCIPVKVHGDDAKGFYIQSWTSLYTKSFNRFVIWAHCVERMVELLTEDSADKVMNWSMAAMAEGVWPACDWDGQPFRCTRANSYRARRAGQQLAGGWRAIFSAFVGDQKFFVERFGLGQTWKKHIVALIAE